MSRPLRVAHVGTFKQDSADGTDKTVAGLVTWLPEHDVEVEVWQPEQGADTVHQTVEEGVRIWHLPAYAAPLNMALGAPSAVGRFAAWRARQVDLVHFHSGLIPEHVAIALQVGVPYAIAPNGMYSPANLQGRYRLVKQAWLWLREVGFIRRARLLQAVSQGEADVLRRQFPDVRVALVPNALDLARLPDITSMSTSRTLVYLGRLGVEQKGLDVMLHGFRQYLSRTGEAETRLLLVGPDYRGGRAEAAELIRRLQLDERVELRDPVFGLAKWSLLASAAAVVQPSRWDGLPFSLLEALAARRPVLVSPGTNLAELVAEYRAGVVVRAESKDVARGLEALLGRTDSERAAMGRAGRRLVEDHFTWPESARRMAEAYREALHGNLAAHSVLSGSHSTH